MIARRSHLNATPSQRLQLPLRFACVALVAAALLAGDRVSAEPLFEKLDSLISDIETKILERDPTVLETVGESDDTPRADRSSRQTEQPLEASNGGE